MPEDKECPPFITLWGEDWSNGTLRLVYPTGHVARIERTGEEYWAPDERGDMRRHQLNGYRGTVTAPDGKVMYDSQLGNNKPRAKEMMADRGYRYAYGIVDYALATKGKERGRYARK